jgi:hypothetical protein
VSFDGQAADHNGGYKHAGADRALITECHRALGPISRVSPNLAGDHELSRQYGPSRRLSGSAGLAGGCSGVDGIWLRCYRSATRIAAVAEELGHLVEDGYCGVRFRIGQICDWLAELGVVGAESGNFLHH